MRTIEKNVYMFNELSAKAKEAARDWYREGSMQDEWWDCLYDDAANVADILGIDLRQRRVTLMNGNHRYDPAIFFSGFCSQGDGACFEGTYAYAKGSAKKIREYAPLDKYLHGIADALQEIQRKHFYRLRASMSHRGPYCHSGCMSVDVEDCTDQYRDLGDSEQEIRDVMREFADWIFTCLSDEYYYITSDECVDENIEANEYEFFQDGERV